MSPQRPPPRPELTPVSQSQYWAESTPEGWIIYDSDGTLELFRLPAGIPESLLEHFARLFAATWFSAWTAGEDHGRDKLQRELAELLGLQRARS